VAGLRGLAATYLRGIVESPERLNCLVDAITLLFKLLDDAFVLSHRNEILSCGLPLDSWFTASFVPRLGGRVCGAKVLHLLSQLRNELSPFVVFIRFFWTHADVNRHLEGLPLLFREGVNDVFKFVDGWS
jgi:hypothetical protein